MIKTIIKTLLLAGLGLAIIILIPDLFLPLATLLDEVLDTDLFLALTNVYNLFGPDIMTLLVIQFSTFAINIIIRWTIGAKK